ncbi:hypothetical protein GCM10028803_44720 [Larkinella knui]|uniref:DUF2490 domain-containing protein n=1 Tax=Larkinella knui TaxID=2025310 RepID=A0A3P1CP40_9BACT|nr:hypothetical protein [Larkinella knui]RRB15081.1 hypothetical protein EHT87_11040 [Larkinella knui]
MNFISFSRAITAVLLLLIALPSQAQLRLDLESGLVLGTAYTEVRIPNQGGTLVDLSKQLRADPQVFYRARLGYTIANRHTISALYAPLTVRFQGRFNQDINFNNVLFPASQPTTAYYKFNSYRLTYRYDFVVRERWRVGAGFTAKIRDANTRFEGEGRQADFDNVGFVPLLNFYVAYRPGDRWRVLLEGDALGAKVGRAEDIFLGAAYQVSPKLGFKLGYRVVEGGADSDEVYTFTWINYASAGVLLTF